MSRPSALLLLTLAATLVLASFGRTTSAETPAVPADRQGEAPPAYTLTAPIERMVMIRLRNKTDVLEGLKEAVAREGIRNAIIVGGFGSVIRYHVHVVTAQEPPFGNAFMKVDKAMDVLNVAGYVIDGRLHPHITLADDKVATGGHLEPGTDVLTFLNVALAVLPDDASMARFDDWEWK
jgi:predicted DNA-binding protein with PD1-like motif